MYLNILKRDLKRKKSMNLILLLFIILATTFVACGLNNVITVLQGTDYYFDKAGIGDYIIITQGEDVGHAEELIRKKPYVKSVKTDDIVYLHSKGVLLGNGKPAVNDNISMIEDLSKSAIQMFGENNEVISEVETGNVYITGSFMENNNLQVGDKITIEHGDVSVEFTIAGRIKDALLGSDFMGNIRFLVSEEDYNRFYSDKLLYKSYRGEIAYIETDDVAALAANSSDIPGVVFNDSREVIKTCYVMDLILAMIVLVLSICLIIVAFVVLRFSISVSIQEEYREIGVMKAIGIKDCKIRSLYIVKYLGMSLIGASIGFALSIPLGHVLLLAVSKNMVLGNDAGLFINVISSAFTVLLIVLYAYRCTGKVKKFSPIDAIRSGQTGERFRKKTWYRIGKSHVRPNLYLAINDFVSSPKRFLTVIVSFFICTLFVLLMVNTANTMGSDRLIDLFTSKSDLYITDDSEVMRIMESASIEDLRENLREKSDFLTQNGMPATCGRKVAFKCKTGFHNKEYMFTCLQDICLPSEYDNCFEGTMPRNINEVTITPQISEMTGAKIGDTLEIALGEKTLNCIISGYFETMNQMGEVIRLHEDAPTDISQISVVFQTQVNFTDNPTEEEIKSRQEKISELLQANVETATEFCISCVKVYDMVCSVKLLLMGITMIVIMLVTILVERSFIADEFSQIAVLKAMGFRDRDVIRWQTLRFGMVAFLAAVLAAIASIPMTRLCISPIFGMMGARKIDYNIKPLEIFLIYPGMVFTVTMLFAWLTALYTKKISCKDTANIE